MTVLPVIKVLLATLTLQHSYTMQCVRIRKEIMMHQEQINLAHLDSMIDSIDTLYYKKKIIKEKTMDFMKENIAALTKGWCNLKKVDKKKNKRQVIPAIVVWILGEFVISPTINLLFGSRTTTSNINNKWKNYIKNIDKTTKVNNIILTKLEKQVHRLTERMNAEENIQAMISEIMFENKLFQDLGTRGRENNVLNKIFEDVIQKYTVINATVTKTDYQGMPIFALPDKAYNLKIKVIKDPYRNCSKTRVIITGQALVPSQECFKIMQHSTGYLKLLTSDGKCVITGNDTIKLGDGSQVSTSNFVVGQKPCSGNNTMNIKYNDNTIYLSPLERGKITMKCGNMTHTYTSYRDRKYLAQPSCMASFQASEERRGSARRDYFSVRTKIVNSKGNEIRGKLNKTEALILKPFKKIYKEDTDFLDAHQKLAKMIADAGKEATKRKPPSLDKPLELWIIPTAGLTFLFGTILILILYYITKKKIKTRAGKQCDQHIELKITNAGRESLHEKLGREAVKKRSYLKPLLMKEDKVQEVPNRTSNESNRNQTINENISKDKWCHRIKNGIETNSDNELNSEKDEPVTPPYTIDTNIKSLSTHPTTTTNMSDNYTDQPSNLIEVKNIQVEKITLGPNTFNIPIAPVYCNQQNTSPPLYGNRSTAGTLTSTTSHASLLKVRLEARRMKMGYNP